MQLVNLPSQIKITEREENTAQVTIEPCFPGYGVTLGNTLRRVLLSSLPGAAVTAVKISSISHEFSTIPGVKEDVIEIILNLKQLRLKLYDTSFAKMSLNIKGEKEVKAKDIKASSSIKIANPDLHIATLTSKKSRLEMEIFVKSGQGYEASEERGEKEKEIGIIPIDALYSPVRKVGFRTENIRLGKKTNYDRLIMDIETDGTIDVKKALDVASHILVDHFKLFYEKEEKPKIRKEGAAKKKEIKPEGKVSIENLKLSSRTLKSLEEVHIKSISKLIKTTPKKLLKIKGMGEKGIKEITRKLKKSGLSLKE